MMDKSELFISWHMLIKEKLDITLQTLDSLQGLYDELVIAVDDDESQDELFEAIKIYPNTLVYRQKLPDGHFGNARQDILNRLSEKATYIGWSDADEPLASPSPREIREYLYNEQPPAVNVTLRYLYKAGPCYPGDHFRLRMWRADEPREWRDAVHEWPAYIGNNNGSAVSKMDIVFNHLKQGIPLEQAELRIRKMNEENNSEGWRYPRLSGEYRGIGMYPEAVESAQLGLLSPRFDIQKVSMTELFYVCEEMGDKWGNVSSVLADMLVKYEQTRTSPFLLEYLALAYFYSGKTREAVAMHDLAVAYNVNEEFKFVIDNNKYFHPIEDVSDNLSLFSINKRNWYVPKGDEYGQLGSVNHEVFDLKIYDYPLCPVNTDSVILDIGANVGMFAVYFLERGAKKIVSVEPGIAFEALVKNTTPYGNRVVCINKGCWNCNDTLEFVDVPERSVQNCVKGKMNYDNSFTTKFVQCTTIDNLVNELNLDNISFIKLDVEGAEFEAICGAEYVIKTFKPNLAVSLYHKNEDVECLPKLILDFVPSYKYDFIPYMGWCKMGYFYF